MSVQTLDDRGTFPRCPECGGHVELVARAGRTREFLKGVNLDIPADIGIPTCTQCGEESMSADISEELDKRLAKVLQERLRNHVQQIQAVYVGTSQLELEEALRVTPSYLSHILKGRKLPSGTLVEMLALFAEVPGALEHALPSKRGQLTLGAEPAHAVAMPSVVYCYYSVKSFAGECIEPSRQATRRLPPQSSYRSKFADRIGADAFVSH